MSHKLSSMTETGQMGAYEHLHQEVWGLFMLFSHSVSTEGGLGRGAGHGCSAKTMLNQIYMKEERSLARDQCTAIF